MLKKNEINLLSKTLPFWNNLDQDEKELLISNAFIEDVDQGQLIHQGNNDCIGILVVIKGCLRTYIVSDEGKEVTLYRLNANDVCVLSAACVLECIDFDVLVEAQTKCQRLAAFLLDESNRSNSLDIKITHEQIAQNLNSAREVVSRMLNYFAKEGYVSLSRGQIHIIDKQSLSSLI